MAEWDYSGPIPKKVGFSNTPKPSTEGFKTPGGATITQQDVQDVGYKAATGIMGTPVDLVNMFLKPIGLGSEKPIMGSDWMNQQAANAGLVSNPEVGAVDLAAMLAIPDPLDIVQFTKYATPMLAGAMIPSKATKQTDETKDLIIQHNLDQKNLAYAEEMGGLPVPSLAITNKGTPLEGFGDITLLGDKELATPSKQHKVFGSDIYSPRHPKEDRTYKTTDIRTIDNMLTDYQEKLGRTDGVRDSSDIQDLENNVAMKLKFLEEEKGVNIDIPTKKSSKYEQFMGMYPDEMKLAQEGNFDFLKVGRDPEFIKKVENELDKKLSFRNRGTAKEVYGEEGIENIAMNRVHDIKAMAEEEGKPDLWAARKLINEQITNYKDEFDNYVNDVKESYPYKSTFTEGGKTRGYTERNIINFLKKDLRGGENWNYGAGSVRAMVTPEYKTIDEIVANKDKLVSKDQMEAVKQEMDNNLQILAQEIASPKEPNPFIANDIAIEFIQDYAVRGKRAIDDYMVEVDDEALDKIDDYLDSLKDAPTEYFESKMLKRMDIGDFKYAIIPDNASEKTKKILEDKGIEYSMYNSKIDGERAKEIQKVAEDKGYLFALPLSIGLGGAAMYEGQEE